MATTLPPDVPPPYPFRVAGPPDSPEPRSPQATALRWVEAIMDDGDLAAAWPLTDPVLRLVLAQDWVWMHRHQPMIGHGVDWDVMARGLAACPPGHPLWDRFAAELIERWQHIWMGFSARTWAPWDQPEVLDLDVEVVTFLESHGEPVRFEPGRSAFARRFALRHSPEGWLVASVNGDQMFVPGWPPSLEV